MNPGRHFVNFAASILTKPRLDSLLVKSARKTSSRLNLVQLSVSRKGVSVLMEKLLPMNSAQKKLIRNIWAPGART